LSGKETSVNVKDKDFKCEKDFKPLCIIERDGSEIHLSGDDKYNLIREKAHIKNLEIQLKPPHTLNVSNDDIG